MTAHKKTASEKTIADKEANAKHRGRPKMYTEPRHCFMLRIPEPLYQLALAKAHAMNMSTNSYISLVLGTDLDEEHEYAPLPGSPDSEVCDRM